MKLSSINTIHVKQQHNVGFFIFRFTLMYMLSNVYINKIHSMQYLYIIRLYCRKIFPIFQFLCCIQRNPSLLISKHLGRKYFSMEQLQIDSYMLLCKEDNSFSINHYILAFNLLAIETKNISFYCIIYIFRLFT